MYEEQFSQYRAEIAFSEYQKDPKAWSAKVGKQSRAVWFGLTIIYIVFASVFLVFLFPTTLEVSSWLRSERVQFWLPLGCAALGLLTYLLKTHFLLAFGATELAFSAASAYNFRAHVVSDGIASWAAGVAVIYLFAKGFENSHKGLISVGMTQASKSPLADTPKSMA